jgi:alpha-L-rhamnosidase
MTTESKVEVPAHQVVEKILATNFNQAFADKAEALKPELHEWTDHPLSVITFTSDPEEYFKCRTEEQYPISTLPSLSYGKGDQLILDFGSHRVGYLSFHLGVQGVNVDAPARLRIIFGEIPYDVTEDLHPCNTWISTSWLPDEVINVDWLPTDVNMPRRYSFRYVKIEVIDTSPKYKVRFSNVKVRAVSAVSQETMSAVEPLPVHNDDLASLDRISMVTLRDCMQTVFEDGPRRDRRLWLGDLRLQALTNYVTFRDYSLIKRCLYLFAAVPRSDASLPACIFEKPHLTPATDYILSYDVLFGPIVHDYVLASHDFETAVELWDTILGSTQRTLLHIDAKGKFHADATPAWQFLDWDENLDTNAGMHGLVLYAFKAVNALALLISKAVPYEDLVQRMAIAASDFYDDERRVFISGTDNQISWTSAAWLSLCGAFLPSICLHALKTVISNTSIPASASSSSSRSTPVLKPLTPYAYHHVAHALALNGGEVECLQLLDDYWGGMVRAGADTFWECFDAEDSRRSPYGDCHNNSYCHAWSCTPSWLIRGVLGDYLKDKAEGTGKVE